LSSLVFLVVPRPPSSTLLPYTTLFRSVPARDEATHGQVGGNTPCPSGEERADNRKFGPTRSLVYLYWQRFACPPYSARQHGLVVAEHDAVTTPIAHAGVFHGQHHAAVIAMRCIG